MTQMPETSTATPQLQDFDAFIQATMQDWKLPGLAIAIVKDGEVVYSQGFGKRNVAQNLDVTPQTLFAIGSCSKAFTATAMGILVDEGKLDWDTPVRSYLPTFKLHDPVATEHMTPRDLLCHRSGLPRHDLTWYNASRTRQELFDCLQYLEPSKDFRAFWQYQNLMYMVAGYLIGERAGQSWEDFVQQRILTPLEMTNSNFSVLESQQTTDFSMPYGKVKDQVEEVKFHSKFEAVAPAGAINSNVEEMSKWLQCLLHQGKFGEKQIISETQLAETMTPQMVITAPRQHTELSYNSYALGWIVSSYKGHLLVQHSGGIDGFSALTTLLPDDHIGIVVLTNLNGCPVHTIVTYNACDRLLGLGETPWNERIKQEQEKLMQEVQKSREKSDLDRVPDTHPSHALAAYTGQYQHPAYGTIKIENDHDQLKLLFNELSLPLQHYHYDIFEATWEQVETSFKLSFTTNLQGDIASLASQLEPAVKEIVFKRIANKEMMEPSFLEQFVGDYEVAAITLKVLLKGEQTLFLSVPSQPDYELVPYKGTIFQFKNQAGFSVEFKRDETNHVQAIVVTQPHGVVTAQKKTAHAS